ERIGHLVLTTNVTTDGEMVESILQYCNTHVRKIIEGIPHFHNPNWDSLKDTWLHYFDANIFDEQFFERDLKALVSRFRSQSIMSLHDFQAYNCDFTCVGGWMKHKGRLTTHEHNHYFWAGL
ncbi:hypothetical protein EDC04DRAFT_2544474, partial [Pisolithus marmoratus]